MFALLLAIAVACAARPLTTRENERARKNAMKGKVNCDPSLRDPPMFFPTQARTPDQHQHDFDCEEKWSGQAEHNGHPPSMGFERFSGLITIPGRIFVNQPDLYGLGIAFCKNLTDWQPDAWVGLSGLTRLALTYNNISKVPARAFASFREGLAETEKITLSLLDFQGNAITVWEKGWSESLPPNMTIVVSEWASVDRGGKDPHSDWVETPSICTRKKGVDKCRCAEGMIGGPDGYCIFPSLNKEEL